MKPLTALLLICTSAFCSAAGTIGILDEQEVFAKYAKAIDGQTEIRKSQDAARASVGEREKLLVELQQELQSIEKRAQDPLLSEAGKKSVASEFQAKGTTFQQRRNDLQKFVNEAQAAIQQRAAEMNKQILADARTQAEKVAKAKGLQIVLGKGAVFFSDATLDVTIDVLKELNDSYRPAAADPVTPALIDKPAAPAVTPAAGEKPAAK